MHIQKTMVFFATLLLSIVMLSGCASSTDGSSSIDFPGAYKIDIQQGNIITQEQVNQLKPGMSRAQVTYVMGTPLLEDLFDKDRWYYIYSNQPGGKKSSQKTMLILFSDNKLSSIQGDIKPEHIEK